MLLILRLSSSIKSIVENYIYTEIFNLVKPYVSSIIAFLYRNIS